MVVFAQLVSKNPACFGLLTFGDWQWNGGYRIRRQEEEAKLAYGALRDLSDRERGENRLTTIGSGERTLRIEESVGLEIDDRECSLRFFDQDIGGTGKKSFSAGKQEGHFTPRLRVPQ